MSSSLNSFTPFTAFLHCNDPPPDDVAVKLRVVVEGSKKELDAIQKKMKLIDTEEQALHAKLAELGRKKQTLSQRAAQLDANIRTHIPISSSLRRLPIEILAHIFFIASPSFVSPLARKVEPWTLAQVSRRWRSVALGTPCLWSAISLDLSHFPTLMAIPKAPVTILEDVLHRSSNHDLSIRFISPLEPPIKPHTAATAKWFETLISHCERCKTIDFTFNGYLVLPLDNLTNRLPRLESFRIHFEDPEDLETGYDPSLISFGIAPSLHSVYISDFDNPPLIVLPWNQLRSLSMYRGNAEDISYLLGLCPLLNQLDFREFHSEYSVYPSVNFVPTEFTHSNLTSLHLHHTDVLRIFERSFLPSLQSLDLGEIDRDFDGLGLVRFLKRNCSSPLTTLSFILRLCYPDDDGAKTLHFIHALSLATQVSSLIVTLEFSLPLPFLTAGLANEYSLPALQALKIQYSAWSFFSAPAFGCEFVDMVEARMTAPKGRLVDLQVTFTTTADEASLLPNLSDGDRDRLKALNNAELGRKISIEWFNNSKRECSPYSLHIALSAAFLESGILV